jgi:hypothetical protein
MDLFSLNNTTLSPIAKEQFDLEKDIQKLVEENLGLLFGLEFVSTEFSLGAFRLDSLAFDQQANAFVIIEYKKGTSYSVIDQGYSYLSLMLNNKADFILEFNEKMEGNLKKDQIDWSSSKVIFVSPSFNNYQKNSVNFKDVPFELWEIKKFEGDLIALEQHQSKSTQSINSLAGATSDSVISQVSAEVKSTTEEELVAKLSPKLQSIWQTLREKLEDYSDTFFYTTRAYVGWRKGGKTVAFLNLRKNTIVIEILRGNRSAEGEDSKNFFYLDDPEKMAEELLWNWKSSRTGHKYRIKLKESEEIDYVLFLVNQKYESM